jgi:hypothetical protein
MTEQFPLMKHNKTAITKASGERSSFSSDKLRNSLLRSGASPQAVDVIVNNIVNKLYDGITTGQIYGLAFKLLKQYKKGPAAKYKLKTAIMELGPTGFPFEQFIARVFDSLGYTTRTGQMLEGKCVKHEIDVLATKGDEENLIECKFHQHRGLYCDVKIPLYISARFGDIILHRNNLALQKNNHIFRGWLVTNTHFTKDAIAFGLCAGLNLMGWDFPERNSLRDLIDRYGLHPLTSLTTLTKHEKLQLLEKNIVLCSELEQHWDLVLRIVHKDRLLKVKEECGYLAGTPKSATAIFV